MLPPLQADQGEEGVLADLLLALLLAALLDDLLVDVLLIVTVPAVSPDHREPVDGLPPLQLQPRRMFLVLVMMSRLLLVPS